MKSRKTIIIVIVIFICLLDVFLAASFFVAKRRSSLQNAVILFEDESALRHSNAFGVSAGLISNAVVETIAETLATPAIVVAENNRPTSFHLVYDDDFNYAVKQNILSIQSFFQYQYHIDLPVYSDSEEQYPCEIIVGSSRRGACWDLTSSLSPGEYAIRVIAENDSESGSFNSIQLLIAFNGEYARMAALDRFLTDYCKADEAIVPSNLDIRGTCTAEDAVITSSIPRLRDPFILVEDGVYYAYGTGWHCWKNTSGSLSGAWQDLGRCVEIPPEADTNYWAPEVYHYNDKYYMITTYHSSYTWRRGCALFISDRPEGPFVKLSPAHITPSWRDCIDGTLYLDEDGQPWLVFVLEWTYTLDQVGRMAAAKLSDDLTSLITYPIELFRADSPEWEIANVTDGCWMYQCETGELLMLWSNNDAGGYAVGVARSDNGKIDGKWSQDRSLLYSKKLTGDYAGGHPMTFTDTDGQRYLAIHAPNFAIDDRMEKPVFIPIKERAGTLVWDLWKEEPSSFNNLYLIKVRIHENDSNSALG